MASTSSGILPAACAASVWKRTPACLETLPISAIGFTVPTSLLAAMMLTSAVRGVMARATASGETRPRESGRMTVTAMPRRSRSWTVSRTAWCSAAWVMTWSFAAGFPGGKRPRRAMSLASVAPLVKMTSRGSAPRSAATWARATSTASLAFQPYAWVFDEALPKCSRR